MPKFGRWMVPVLAVVMVSGSALAASRGDPVKKFDTDSDGTLDHIEVRKAATALFARLDPDHDGTLDVRELRADYPPKRSRPQIPTTMERSR